MTFAISQALLGPLPGCSISEGITWCFVECQLAAGCKNSWAFFAGSYSSKMCHYKTFLRACLAFIMCLASGLWYLAVYVYNVLWITYTKQFTSTTIQLKKKKSKGVLEKKVPYFKAIIRKTKLCFHFKSCCAQMLFSQTNQCLLINRHLINSSVSH